MNAMVGNLTLGDVVKLENTGHSRLTAIDGAGRNAPYAVSINAAIFAGSTPADPRHISNMKAEADR